MKTLEQIQTYIDILKTDINKNNSYILSHLENIQYEVEDYGIIDITEDYKSIEELKQENKIKQEQIEILKWGMGEDLRTIINNIYGE